MSLRFRCRAPSGQFVLKSIKDTLTFADLKKEIEKNTKIPSSQQRLKCGYPPKVVSGKDDESLKNLGVQSGNIIVEKTDPQPSSSTSGRQTTSSTTSSSSSSSVPSKEHVPQSSEKKEASDIAHNHDDLQMIRRKIPDDNSCLFAAVTYAMETCSRGRAKADELRGIIASVVLSDPSTYNSALLEKSPEQYCSWILEKDHWGGSIELSILSNYYGIEIAAIDVISQNLHCFGEDKGYSKRIYLMYDGIHYDVLVLNVSADHPESMDKTIFPSNDILTHAKAIQVTSEAHKNKQFTDVYNFTLRCLDCQTGLKGQDEAQKHAQTTGHVNFAEYK